MVPYGEVFTAERIDERFVLTWKDKIYTAYVFVSDDNSPLFGARFGQIKNTEYPQNAPDRIYLVVGQPPEKWVISRSMSLMGFHVVYKEDSVTEIPPEIAALETIL